MNSTLVVGRRTGQVSPDLSWLSTDGSFAAFNLFVKIDLMGRQEGSKRDLGKFLRLVGSSSAASGNPLTWSWGPVDFSREFKLMNGGASKSRSGLELQMIVIIQNIQLASY